MKNPFRHRWAIEGYNPSTGQTQVIRRYRFDRQAALQRIELLNAFAGALRLRTQARLIRID